MQVSKPVELNDHQIKGWMRRLINRAESIGNQDEVPVAAVILNEFGQSIGHGSNCRNRTSDPLGHAEIIALRQASWLKGDWRFNECTLLVTLEPCHMCAAALIQARMGKVIFAAKDPKRGGLGGSIDLSVLRSAHHRMIVQGGILEKEARTQLEDWFRKKRKYRR
mgnify:CR=1 FL=1